MNSDGRGFRSKSKFRHLCSKSVSSYRKPLFDLISFLLWFNFQCRSRKKFVNCVDLGLTSDIKSSVSKLYGFLVDPSMRGDLMTYREDLSKHVHRLLTALLTGQGPSDRKVHGPFDYVLILAMYLGNGNFQEAERISGYCAMTQYCMRVIVVHCARMGGLHADYAPLPEMDSLGVEDQDADDVEENPLLPPIMLPLPEDHELGLASGLPDGSDLIVVENPLLEHEESDNSLTSNDLWKSTPTISSSDKFINPMDVVEDEELTPQTEDMLKNLHPDGLLLCVLL